MASAFINLLSQCCTYTFSTYSTLFGIQLEIGVQPFLESWDGGESDKCGHSVKEFSLKFLHHSPDEKVSQLHAR